MTSKPLSHSSEAETVPDRFSWWRRALIWAGFLALIYVLREFFLIAFLTFLICFVVRGLVGFVTQHLSHHRTSRSLELILTLSIFVALCFSLYGLGRYFVPRLIHQGKSLLTQLQNSSPEELQNRILANTVGTWKFRQAFGSSKDARYQNAFEEFHKSGLHGEGLYQEFPQLQSSLQAEFESEYEQAQVQHLQRLAMREADDQRDFEQWFLRIKAPQLFHERYDYFLTRWQAKYSSSEKASELDALKKRPDFEEYRARQIQHEILADIEADPVQLVEFKSQWIRSVSLQRWADFRKSPEYQAEFQKFYETRRAKNPAAAPLDYQFFKSLVKAYPKGKDAFLATVREHYETSDESLAHEQHDFESAKKLELSHQWWATSHVADWVREHVKQDGPRALAAVVAWAERGLEHLVRVPVQVVTSLALSIFVLIEWHGLKEGVANLRETRLQPIVDEILPGMIAFGKLIGKSFQGQVVIAAFNACFTFFALWLIGIEFKSVLVLTVFLFSFIPAIGVILSGIPICAVAVAQPGGSLLTALQVIAAIAVIHLLEAMVLSPRIIGKIGHLHPVLVIVILLVAEHFFGMWGLILGVPVAIYLIRVVILDTVIPGVYEPVRGN